MRPPEVAFSHSLYAPVMATAEAMYGSIHAFFTTTHVKKHIPSNILYKNCFSWKLIDKLMATLHLHYIYLPNTTVPVNQIAFPANWTDPFPVPSFIRDENPQTTEDFIYLLAEHLDTLSPTEIFNRTGILYGEHISVRSLPWRDLRFYFERIAHGFGFRLTRFDGSESKEWTPTPRHYKYGLEYIDFPGPTPEPCSHCNRPLKKEFTS